MPVELWLAGAAAVHVLAILLCDRVSRARGRRLRLPTLLFCLLLPVCGPVTCWIIASAKEPRSDATDHLRRNEQHYAQLISAGNGASDIVPLEEAFLINTPQKRRELMLNLLRSDPRKYLDLLLLARFNEDTETAHYATATLTEIQRQIQLELQQAQMEVVRRPNDTMAHSTYVHLLKDYVDSGLLEGHLLLRQRMVLEQAMAAFPEGGLTPELMNIRVSNLLELQQPAEARGCAQKMISLWPQDETGWLALLHVCVETRDRAGLQALMARASGQDVEWTRSGLERMQYFDGKDGNEPLERAAAEGAEP
ncbi:MAG: hypothetical protein ACI4PG_05270 [Candidatus Ventricola sp.]